ASPSPHGVPAFSFSPQRAQRFAEEASVQDLCASLCLLWFTEPPRTLQRESEARTHRLLSHSFGKIRPWFSNEGRSPIPSQPTPWGEINSPVVSRRRPPPLSSMESCTAPL